MNGKAVFVILLLRLFIKHNIHKHFNLLRSMKLKLWNTIKEKKIRKKDNYGKKYVVPTIKKIKNILSTLTEKLI